MSIASKDSRLNDLDSFSRRLKYIVDAQGVKQSHMADKLGLSPSGLHYILNNDIKFSKNAKKIAKYLNVSETWLLKGEGDVYVENNTIKTYKVPVYYPDQLKLHLQSKQSLVNQMSAHAVTTIAYSKEVLGVYITETDLSPKFEVGDVVIFEKTEQFKNGEAVLVYLYKPNQIVIRYGFNVRGSVILLAVDGEPVELNLSQGDLLLGAYRECFKKTSFREML